MEIFRRATINPSVAKNPLTAGAAERREWQNGDVSNQEKVYQSSRSIPPTVVIVRPSISPGHSLQVSVNCAKHECAGGLAVMSSKSRRRLISHARNSLFI